ncbi:MAG: hypothetical protein ACI8Y8_001261 [Planctomycetota bacterium]|jgi:hypothetical protein
MPHRSQLDGIQPAASTLDVLTFRARPAGTIVSELFGRFGAGPILINGVNPDLGAQNAAVIFDTANPTGGDPDLGTPNEDFGGPGVGDGGSASGAYPNTRRLGNVLIVAENLTDADGDGLVDDPGDSADTGTALTLDFSAIGGATLERMTILDMESISMPAVVEMIGPAGELLASQILPIVGDNGVAQVDLGHVPNVMLLHITLGGSAAIDNIVFEPYQGSTLTGRVWNDDDEDGLQGPDESGLPGVEVILASTGLGPVAFSTTDANGIYTFSSIAVGSYQLSVSEGSLPVGAFQTPCDVGNDDTIDNDCSPASIDVEFTSNTITTDFGFAAPPECAGTIGDLVFWDVNGNNIQDLDDVGIPDATVMLYDEPSGNLLDIQITDENGNYQFGGLCEGIYAVAVDITTFVGPAGGRPPLGPSICDVGDDGSVDSECGPECVVIFEMDTVTGDLVNDTIDWGFTECGDCSGRMNALSLRYNGPGPVFIEIVQHQGATVFADVVETGDILSFFGQDNQGTLGSRINIFVDGIPATEIHTSCSEALFIGLAFDDFEIVTGSSRNAGALCAPGEFP